MPLNYQVKRKLGLSLIDLIIGVIILTLVVIIALHNLLENPDIRKIRKPAERNLRAFAHGNKLDALQCEGVDNDQDGWVLCKAKDRQGKMVILNCIYEEEQEVSPLCKI